MKKVVFTLILSVLLSGSLLAKVTNHKDAFNPEKNHIRTSIHKLIALTQYEKVKNPMMFSLEVPIKGCRKAGWNLAIAFTDGSVLKLKNPKKQCSKLKIDFHILDRSYKTGEALWLLTKTMKAIRTQNKKNAKVQPVLRKSAVLFETEVKKAFAKTYQMLKEEGQIKLEILSRGVIPKDLATIARKPNAYGKISVMTDELPYFIRIDGKRFKSPLIMHKLPVGLYYVSIEDENGNKKDSFQVIIEEGKILPAIRHY